LAASKRAQRDPSLAKQANDETRRLAKEMVMIRKQSNRLNTSKAQLQSVGMQVNEAFAVRKIEGSIRVSAGIMKDVNSLLRLPELTSNMRQLSQELVKAGIIEEMINDEILDNSITEDTAADDEVDQVLAEILKDRMADVEVPTDEIPTGEELEPEPVEADDGEEQRVLDAMRERLEILKS
jgi:charged multivesicular body protein 3